MPKLVDFFGLSCSTQLPLGGIRRVFHLLIQPVSIFILVAKFSAARLRTYERLVPNATRSILNQLYNISFQMYSEVGSVDISEDDAVVNLDQTKASSTANNQK